MVSVIMTRSLYLLSAMIHTMMMRNRMNITPTAMPITATVDLQLAVLSRLFRYLLVNHTLMLKLSW